MTASITSKAPCEAIDPIGASPVPIAIRPYRRSRASTVWRTNGPSEYRCAQTRMTKQSAERRPDDKAESESSADETHPFGAVALVGGVGDVSLGSRNRRGAGAVNRARGEQPKKRIGEAIDEVAERRS